MTKQERETFLVERACSHAAGTMAHGGLREGIGTAMTVRPTSRFNSPGLAPLTSAAERRGLAERW